jgi:hypothetical protein
MPDCRPWLKLPRPRVPWRRKRGQCGVVHADVVKEIPRMQIRYPVQPVFDGDDVPSRCHALDARVGNYDAGPRMNDILPGLAFGDVDLVRRRSADSHELELGNWIFQTPQPISVPYVGDLASRFIELLHKHQLSIEHRNLRQNVRHEPASEDQFQHAQAEQDQAAVDRQQNSKPGYSAANRCFRQDMRARHRCSSQRLFLRPRPAVIRSNCAYEHPVRVPKRVIARFPR